MSDSSSGNENSTEDTAPTTNAPDLPGDAAGWRALVASAPSKDLLRLIQREKPRAARLLSGFRAGPEAVKNPVIVSRLVEEALKQPNFAQEVASLAPAAPAEEAPHPEGAARSNGSESPQGNRPAPPTPAAQAGVFVLRLREQVNKQRALLKEKDERIARLEEQTAQFARERDAARAEAEGARADARAADEEADRQKRLRERDARKASTVSSKAEEAAATATANAAAETRAAVAGGAAGESPRVAMLVMEEALRRLLSRGKYAVVAEVCREAVLFGNLKEAPASARGKVHALYAAALYGQSEDDRASEQDQRATAAFLDSGDVAQAAESFARILAHDTLLRSALTGEDTALLRRLVLLADKSKSGDALRAGFTRLRIVSPQGFSLLVRALRRSGKRFSDFADALMPAPGAAGGAVSVKPDELISLPTPPGGAVPPSVTPRRLVEAVDSGDARYVLRVRDAIAELRRTGGPQGSAIADGLLSAVAELSAPCVLPFTTAPGSPARAAVVDASNVARHDPDPLAITPKPRAANLLLMRDYLLRRNFFPVLLIADATLRYHLDDKTEYQALIDRGIVRETPPGTSADETLIAEARERDAPLITNDRLSEWGDAARRIERFGFHVLPGGVSIAPA